MPIREKADYAVSWKAEGIGGVRSGDQFPGSLERLSVVFVSWLAAVTYVEWAEKRNADRGRVEGYARGGLADPNYQWVTRIRRRSGRTIAYLESMARRRSAAILRIHTAFSTSPATSGSCVWTHGLPIPLSPAASQKMISSA